ncbi:hypothetical protein PSYMO_38488, partial [Pseudomonas amygdali pv. mori str. 301020]
APVKGPGQLNLLLNSVYDLLIGECDLGEAMQFS